jgi:hypothetical protein
MGPLPILHLLYTFYLINNGGEGRTMHSRRVVRLWCELSAGRSVRPAVQVCGVVPHLPFSLPLPGPTGYFSMCGPSRRAVRINFIMDTSLRRAPPLFYCRRRATLIPGAYFRDFRLFFRSFRSSEPSLLFSYYKRILARIMLALVRLSCFYL